MIAEPMAAIACHSGILSIAQGLGIPIEIRPVK